MNPLFTGTGTALSTPFNADGSIDFESFGRLIDYQIDNGVEALIPCGSTGESVMLTPEEKFLCWELVAKAAAPEKLLIAGTGVDRLPVSGSYSAR